jgi:hypothetical protein
MALGSSIHGFPNNPFHNGVYSPFQTPRGGGGDRSARHVSQYPAPPTQD